MEFKPLFQPVNEILTEYREYYMFPYQIGLKIKEGHPDLWHELIQEYGEEAGSGAGVEYSWASQIARALDYCLTNRLIPGLQKSYMSTYGIQVKAIPPGNEVITIWRIT